jgi:hypothetical protein
MMGDRFFVVCFIVVWFALKQVLDDEDDETREWARTALIAVGLCWLIVRSGLFSF